MTIEQSFAKNMWQFEQVHENSQTSQPIKNPQTRQPIENPQTSQPIETHKPVNQAKTPNKSTNRRHWRVEHVDHYAITWKYCPEFVYYIII